MADSAASPASTPAHPAAAHVTVRVLLFAGLREAAGSRYVDLEVPPESTVGSVRSGLAAAYPALDRLLPAVAFAVNEEYAEESTPVRAGDTIAAIPPVSGG